MGEFCWMFLRMGKNELAVKTAKRWDRLSARLKIAVYIIFREKRLESSYFPPFHLDGNLKVLEGIAFSRLASQKTSLLIEWKWPQIKEIQSFLVWLKIFVRFRFFYRRARFVSGSVANEQQKVAKRVEIGNLSETVSSISSKLKLMRFSDCNFLLTTWPNVFSSMGILISAPTTLSEIFQITVTHKWWSRRTLR